MLIIKDSQKFTSDGYRLSSSAKDHIFFFLLAQLGNLDFTRNMDLGSQKKNQSLFINMHKQEDEDLETQSS